MPRLRQLVLRLQGKLEYELHERDFWNQCLTTTWRLRRQGAHVGWGQMSSYVPIIDGPGRLFSFGGRGGWGDEILVLTQDLAPVPYLGVRREAPVSLGQYTETGHGTILYPGVTVGPRAVTFARAVVTEDVPVDSVAIGNPARASKVYRRWYEARLRDVKEHPQQYTEPAVFTVSQRTPWEHVERGVVEVSVDFDRQPSKKGWRRLVRHAVEWTWGQLRETDEAVLSRERIRRLRKSGIRVGAGSYVAEDAWIDQRPGSVEIGTNCIVGRRAAIIAHDGFAMGYTGWVRIAPIRILDGSVIEPGSTIMPGVTVGPGSIVKAGTIVTKDVPPYTVVAGPSAKPLMSTQQWVREVEAHRAAHPDEYVPDSRTGRHQLPPEAAAPAPAGR